MHAIMGGKQQNKPSGLGGLAGSFLSGSQNSHNNSSGANSGGSGGLAGQLIGSLLGGGKPDKPQSSPAPSSSGTSGPGKPAASGAQQGGLIGASGFLHHGSSVSAQQ